MHPEHILVVGASLAGLRAVEAARRAGFAGRITLVGDEARLPYDRPPLSKEFLDPASAPVPFFPGVEDLGARLGVELRLGQAARRLDLVARTVDLDADRIAYDALLIATGVTARQLPGAHGLAGVHTLRTADDAIAVRAALDGGGPVVVIGAGFIGSEVASAAHQRGLEVTILESLPTPLVRSVGAQAGLALSALHARHGTTLRCGVGVEALEGGQRVEAVRLQDGSRIAARTVIVGIGASPATQWLEGSGLTLDNGVVCDDSLSAAQQVWAAGDVARWRSPDFDQLLRLEHWTNAAEQGAHAVRNMLQPEQPMAYHHIPYFWSDWYGQRIQFVGLPVGDPVLVAGDWNADAFTALYRQGDRFIGALTLNRRADIMKYRALIARRAGWDEGLALAATRNTARAA